MCTGSSALWKNTEEKAQTLIYVWGTCSMAHIFLCVMDGKYMEVSLAFESHSLVQFIKC